MYKLLFVVICLMYVQASPTLRVTESHLRVALLEAPENVHVTLHILHFGCLPISSTSQQGVMPFYDKMKLQYSNSP
jgi:hypothetical protein